IIESGLPNKDAKVMCLKYVELEKCLGEIDHARALYKHSQTLDLTMISGTSGMSLRCSMDSTDVVFADLSHVGQITRSTLKNSGLDGSEYFTSLEAMRNNNSHTMVVSATFRCNLASVFFGEFSQSGSNFGESEDSMDSPTSMNANALMADSTDMDEKFAIMEQTIEALKNPAFTPGESSHVPTCPSGETICFSCCTICPTVARHDNEHYQGTIWRNTIKKTLEGSLEIDNYKENEVDGWTLVTHKKRRHQTVPRIRLPKTRATMSHVNQLQPSKNVKPRTIQKINDSSSQKVRRPITLDEFFLEKIFCGSQISATHVISNTDETKESKGEHNPTITQEDQIDKIFNGLLSRYLRRERRRFPLRFHPLKKTCRPILMISNQFFAIFHVNPSKGNTQVGQIKGNFDQKVFTLFEKSGYNFSNPTKLGELTEELTGEKIHGITKSQMRLRKQRYYVATPKFGLGFSLPEPLRISSKNGKEITSSHYTSIEKTKESKEGKIPQWTSVFECIGRLTPRVSAFERLGHKDERRSSKQVDEYAATSKTSVFHCLGTKIKSLSERRLLEHENQDFFM
ncbi:hypothetical protein H5410_006701, partial [Solanum commersonii]